MPTVPNSPGPTTAAAGRASARRTARRTGTIVLGVVALVLGATTQALACSPPQMDPIDRVLDSSAVGDGGLPYVGAVERRVVAHAPPVPILSAGRSVWIRSRTWGKGAEADVADRRQGTLFGDVLNFISSCPSAHAPRTGDVAMSAVLEQDDGSLIVIGMQTERHRWDPTFPGGLTTNQEQALEERFGSPRALSEPSAGTLAGAWLWSWIPWLVVVGVGAGVVGLLRHRRSSETPLERPGSADQGPG